MPREAMVNRLEKAGFIPYPENHGNELVYYRRHHAHPDLLVKVYTSLPRTGGDARPNGSDAIRVVAIFESPGRGNFGIYKAVRVHRTGTVEGVIERTLERMREAYSYIHTWYTRRAQL